MAFPRETAGPLSVSFRVDANGVVRRGNRTDAVSNPLAASLQLLQLTNPASWFGSPLAQASANVSLSAVLPPGAGSGYGLTLYAFVGDAEGGVEWAEVGAAAASVPRSRKPAWAPRASSSLASMLTSTCPALTRSPSSKRASVTTPINRLPGLALRIGCTTPAAVTVRPAISCRTRATETSNGAPARPGWLTWD